MTIKDKITNTHFENGIKIDWININNLKLKAFQNIKECSELYTFDMFIFNIYLTVDKKMYKLNWDLKMLIKTLNNDDIWYSLDKHQYIMFYKNLYSFDSKKYIWHRRNNKYNKYF
jgi:hypothetical protein